MASCILVSGFEPFGGLATNPALEVLSLLPPEAAGHAVQTVAVPVEYGRCVERVMAAVEEYDPIAVVMVGQARGRAEVTVERVAVNVDDATVPDNAGEVRRGMPINPAGPAAYLSTLPVRDLVERACAAGVPTDVSDTAGCYVCNHLMYGVLDALAASGRADRVAAGFVHVPLMHAQVIEGGIHGEPSMAIADIARALTAMVEDLASAAI